MVELNPPSSAIVPPPGSEGEFAIDGHRVCGFESPSIHEYRGPGIAQVPITGDRQHTTVNPGACGVRIRPAESQAVIAIFDQQTRATNDPGEGGVGRVCTDSQLRKTIQLDRARTRDRRHLVIETIEVPGRPAGDVDVGT